MKNEKDELIESLLKQVESKKAGLERIRNPQFKTNLSLPIFGARINLNAASEEDLISALGLLYSMVSMKDYYPETDFKYHGFSIADWRSDIILKLDQKKFQAKNAELREIEKKLQDLISEDKKKEIELEKIKKLLG